MKQKTSGTPILLQKIFVVGLAAAYVTQTLFQVYMYIQGMQTNVSSEFMAFNLVNIATAFIPLVVWAVVHVTRRDRKLSVTSLFESLVLTLAAMMVMMALGMVQSLMNFYPSGLTGIQNLWWFSFMSTAVPLALVISGLIMVILYLRRQKQW